MCGFCALVAGVTHWTEAGSDAAAGVVREARDLRLERACRVRLANAVLAHYGCTLEDWANGQYIVRSLRGRSELVPALPQVWQAAEAIAGRPLDPLDPALLARLAALATGPA